MVSRDTHLSMCSNFFSFLLSSVLNPSYKNQTNGSSQSLSNGKKTYKILYFTFKLIRCNTIESETTRVSQIFPFSSVCSNMTKQLFPRFHNQGNTETIFGGLSNNVLLAVIASKRKIFEIHFADYLLV